MNRVSINEHVLDIPAGVTARIDPPCAGGYDCLVYRGAEIYTSATPRRIVAGVYLGPFYVTNPDTGILGDFDTLADAMRAIDDADGTERARVDAEYAADERRRMNADW